MHLIQNNQTVSVHREIRLRLLQFGQILLGFQIQVHSPERFGKIEGKRGFAHLSRAQQTNGRYLGNGPP